jgi:uroporphyrinogen decarboxylase
MKGEFKLMSRAMQYAKVSEDVLVRFGSDGRPLIPVPPPSILSQELSEDAFVDEWGITWQRVSGMPYYESVRAPLRDATTHDLDRYHWPDLSNHSCFEGLAAEAQAIREAGYAVVAVTGVSLLEQIEGLRGLDVWFMDMAADHSFAHSFLRRITDLMLQRLVGLLQEVGAYIDVAALADDLGTQNAPIISPEMYRQMVKPYHAELVTCIKSASKAKVLFHSDGSIYPLIGDLVEIGIDIINPVQVSAKDMDDTARLKREFGNQLSFCGAIDSQWVLPSGTIEDVKHEVRRRIRDLAPGGGFILAAVHCIQPDVPPENICAMFDESAKAGCYPITL